MGSGKEPKECESLEEIQGYRITTAQRNTSQRRASAVELKTAAKSGRRGLRSIYSPNSNSVLGDLDGSCYHEEVGKEARLQGVKK